jgi:hypothetical protein
VKTAGCHTYVSPDIESHKMGHVHKGELVFVVGRSAINGHSSSDCSDKDMMECWVRKHIYIHSTNMSYYMYTLLYSTPLYYSTLGEAHTGRMGPAVHTGRREVRFTMHTTIPPYCYYTATILLFASCFLTII